MTINVESIGAVLRWQPKHLPGKHNQDTHGHRFGMETGEPGKFTITRAEHETAKTTVTRLLKTHKPDEFGTANIEELVRQVQSGGYDIDSIRAQRDQFYSVAVVHDATGRSDPSLKRATATDPEFGNRERQKLAAMRDESIASAALYDAALRQLNAYTKPRYIF